MASCIDLPWPQDPTLHISLPEADIEPEVSVLIPFYNGSVPALRTAIASCLEQDVEVEIVVYDDGSTVPLVLSEIDLGSDRVVLARSSFNRGTGAGRTLLNQLATGKYRRYLDHDDRLPPLVLKKQLAAIGDGKLVFGLHEIMGDPRATLHARDKLLEAWDGNPQHIRQLLFNSYCLLGSTGGMWREDVDLSIGPEFVTCDDMAWHRKVIMDLTPGDIRWMDECVTQYHRGSPTSILATGGHGTIYGRPAVLRYQRWREVMESLDRNLKVVHLAYDLVLGGRDWALAQYAIHGKTYGMNVTILMSQPTEMSRWIVAQGGDVRYGLEQDLTEFFRSELASIKPDVVVGSVDDYVGAVGVLFEGNWKKYLTAIGDKLPVWVGDYRLAKIDGVICLSDGIKNLHPVYTQLGKVCLNGVDVERFRQTEVLRPAARAVFGIPEDAKVAIWCGRPDPVKRIDLMQQVAEELLQDENVWVVAVSPESDSWTLEHERFIHIDDAKPWDMPRVLALADVYFSTADFEAPCIALIEAMAAGLPVVVTNTPGGQVEVVEGACGIRVECGDVPGIIEGVLELFEHPEYGTKARTYCATGCHIAQNMRTQVLIYTGNYDPNMHWASYEL